jgi:hypothetical protein
MNHSMYGADRRTHLKIVIVGLLCATLVAAVGIFAHVSDIDLGTSPIKAGQPTAMSGQLPQFARALTSSASPAATPAEIRPLSL